MFTNLVKMWTKSTQKITSKTLDAIAIILTMAVVYITITVINFSLMKWLLGI